MRKKRKEKTERQESGLEHREETLMKSGRNKRVS